MGFPMGIYRPKLTQNCHFAILGGKIWKSGKIEIFWKKLRKGNCNTFCHKINILAKFHHEKTIFDEIRRHLLFLLFYRALTRAPDGLLRKKAIKVEVQVLHTPIFRRICLNPILGGGAILHHQQHFQFYTSKIFFESLNNL